MNHATINHNGKLGIAGSWGADFDTPRLGRLVWSTTHAWSEEWAHFTVEALGADAEWQHWAIIRPVTGGKVTFKTPVRADYELSSTLIKAPRKVKGQPHPWRWESGKWVRHLKF